MLEENEKIMEIIHQLFLTLLHNIPITFLLKGISQIVWPELFELVELNDFLHVLENYDLVRFLLRNIGLKKLQQSSKFMDSHTKIYILRESILIPKVKKLPQVIKLNRNREKYRRNDH